MEARYRGSRDTKVSARTTGDDMKYALLLTVLLLAGCSTEAVYLKHPNGSVVQCGPYDTTVAGHEVMAAMRERSCLDDYQRQGFVRVPKP